MKVSREFVGLSVILITLLIVFYVGIWVAEILLLWLPNTAVAVITPYIVPVGFVCLPIGFALLNRRAGQRSRGDGASA